MSWDIKSERIAARAQAEQARAEAEAIREQSRLAAEQARAHLDREQDEHRRRKAKERRQDTAKALRRHGGLALPAVAVGAPAVIAWNGQYTFGTETMQLGLLAPLLPIAIEGSVLYAAFMAHQAVADSLAAGRYRTLTWALAGVAAGMNFWHGKSHEIGVMLGLTSLLSIVLLELTIALRKAREGKAREGRDAAAIHRALVRRVRYPRLSVSAAALAAARGIAPEEAWRAAWVERYGLGPEASRRERLVARAVLKRERKAACKAAGSGALTIVDGQLVPAAWFGEPGDDAERSEWDGVEAGPADQVREGERLDTSVMGTVVDTTVAMEVPEGIAAIERWLSASADGPGALRELPPAHGRHTERGDERPDERPGERPVSGHGERLGERSGERGSERPDERLAERPVSGQGERADERGGERGSKGRSRKRRTKTRRRAAASGEHAERLATVRRLLGERPRMSGAAIEAETGIPESTARRLAAQVRREQTDGEQANGGER